MDSTCRIFYQTGWGDVDAEGVAPPVYTDRATGVPCRVHPATTGSGSAASTPGAALSVRDDRIWSIPVSSPDVQAGDFVELTTVGPLTDASLAAKTFRIVDPGDASQATARRMRVQVEP